MYHGVSLKVLDVVYMLRRDVYKKLFQLATGHLETTAKERCVHNRTRLKWKHNIGAIQVLRNAFFLEIRPSPTVRNANNVEPYTSVTLFPQKFDTPPHPPALRNT